nr:hypothetical protein [Tanacetum cinerariifolium]
MASMNTRLNIEKLDGNIIQKHGGLKQVGFKQLGPGVEIGVRRVHDEKHVWFEVELQGAQRDREAEVFQVSNYDTTVAQRRLENKQPEEKTNTDCLVKEQQNARILELKRRYFEDYYSEDQYAISIKEDTACPMDDSNITMEEYIRLEEEKAQKCGKVFNWETVRYGKIWYDEYIHDLRVSFDDSNDEDYT